MIHIEFVFLTLATMIVGFVVAYAAFRGYRRHGTRPLLYVAFGFALISLGEGLEGLLFDFTSLSLYQASIVHSVLMVSGMLAILYSIYGPTVTKTEVVQGRGRS